MNRLKDRKWSTRTKIYMGWFAMLALLIAALAGGTMRGNAVGGPEIEGNPDGATERMIVSNGSDKVSRIVYFNTDAKTMVSGGANTPVVSGSACRLAGNFHYAEVRLTGTLSGTAPTLTIKWQNSKDNGTTWSDVGTWTVINATVTPATQSNTVADSGAVVLMNANTPVVTPAVVYGDCWRASYTWGGSGSVGGTFTIIGQEK